MNASPEARTLPAWAEFASAFCAGYNARKDGVRDEEDGQEFIAALSVAYEAWYGQRCGAEADRNRYREALDAIVRVTAGSWRHEQINQMARRALNG